MVYAVGKLVLPWRVHVRELHLHVVAHLVADRAVDEDGEVEVLVAERVVPAEGPLRHCRADLCLVVLVDDAVTVHVNVFHVAYVCRCLRVVVARVLAPRLCAVGVGDNRVAVAAHIDRRVHKVVEAGIYAVGLVAVEGVELFALSRACHDVCPLSVAHESDTARKALHLVLVRREVQLCVPGEVFRVDRVCVYCELDTRVLDVAVVAPWCGESRRAVAARTHNRWQSHRHEHVLRQFLVPVDGQSEVAVEEAEVEADVQLLLCLPLYVEVGHVGRAV